MVRADLVHSLPVQIAVAVSDQVSKSRRGRHSGRESGVDDVVLGQRPEYPRVGTGDAPTFVCEPMRRQGEALLNCDEEVEDDTSRFVRSAARSSGVGGNVSRIRVAASRTAAIPRAATGRSIIGVVSTTSRR